MITLFCPEFHESKQSEPWKNEVAKELNSLTQYVSFYLETSDWRNNSEAIKIDEAAAKATLSLVQRVAEFEEIKTADEVG